MTKQILKRREETNSKLRTLKFDDLNVMQQVDALYEEIEILCCEYYRLLYVERYGEMWLWLEQEREQYPGAFGPKKRNPRNTKREPKEDEVDDLAELYITRILNIPHAVTHYAFHSELVRKRDKCKEAITSVPTKTQKQLELEKAIRYVTQQAGFYIDITEDEADLQALTDAGVKKVRWITYGDDRVCETCEELDGTVWDLDNVPTKPHPRCRCYLIPVTSLNQKGTS